MGKAPTELEPKILNTMRVTLEKLDRRFNIINEPQWNNLVNYMGNANQPIHRWFKNREGFSTELVEFFLQDLPSNALVVDPFCGTGTTQLVSFQHGYRSLGIDVNPLAIFVARVKTRKYSLLDLERFENTLHQIEGVVTEKTPVAPTPNLSIIEKVFLPQVLHSLLALKWHINEHLVRSERDFFFLAWLSILEEVSNVYKEGNGIKYRNRKRTPNGYIDIPIDEWATTHFPKDHFLHVLRTFEQRVEMMIKDARSVNSGEYEPQIYEGDALALDEFVSSGSASLVLFSPPYANNFNYFKSYKVELWMGDFIDDYKDMRELTQRSLRSHVETRLTREGDRTNWYPEQLDVLLNLMQPEHLWTNRIPQAVRGYFYDMYVSLEKIFDVLEQDGRCVIVVGNSAYASILIPTDTILAETGSAIGFDIEKIAVARHLTTSSQQKKALEPVSEYLRESLVVLRKTKKRSWKIKTENGYERQRYVSSLPEYPKPAPHTVYVIRNRGLTDLTHIIHKFPGKFIPHVPRWALEKQLKRQENCAILDPFCGSGTSIIEARLLGHDAYGIDINPLARLISKVKTTPIDSDKLLKSVDEVVTEVQTRVDSNFRPSIETLDHWFSQQAIHDLGIIRDVIDERKDDQDIYDFLVVSFSAIIRRASNADNQSIKTYVSGTLKKKPHPAIPLFMETLREYAERIIQYTEIINPEGKAIITDFGDARDFAHNWIIQGYPEIDLAVTSPPYVKTVDYVYSQMAELFWIGDLFGLENQPKQNEHKRIYIGSEKVYAHQYGSSVQHTGIALIDSLINAIGEDSEKHAYIVYRYFADMINHFQQMHRILKPNAPYIVVVGDSSVSDLLVETHNLLTICAEQVGFMLEASFAYEIRNRYMRFPRKGRGGIVDWDWVLTLRKIQQG